MMKRNNKEQYAFMKKAGFLTNQMTLISYIKNFVMVSNINPTYKLGKRDKKLHHDTQKILNHISYTPDFCNSKSEVQGWIKVINHFEYRNRKFLLDYNHFLIRLLKKYDRRLKKISKEYEEDVNDKKRKIL